MNTKSKTSRIRPRFASDVEFFESANGHTGCLVPWGWFDAEGALQPSARKTLRDVAEYHGMIGVSVQVCEPDYTHKCTLTLNEAL